MTDLRSNKTGSSLQTIHLKKTRNVINSEALAETASTVLGGGMRSYMPNNNVKIANTMISKHVNMTLLRNEGAKPQFLKTVVNDGTDNPVIKTAADEVKVN